MRKLLFTTALLMILAGISWAVPTTVIIRAKSKDAKFIGSSMGGALVVIRDAETGKVLAQGLIEGGTGNTQKIMVEPIRRGMTIADASAAKYEATLDISEPKFVTIEVSGPMGHKQSIAKSSTQVWLVPGRNIEGDGVMVEIPGFSVELLAPQAHGAYKLSGKGLTVPLLANIVMMWGCHITPGGLWDAAKYEVKAIVKHNGAAAGTISLAYADKPNTFEGNLNITEEGNYEVIVYSFDPATGNSGVDKTTFMVTK